MNSRHFILILFLTLAGSWGLWRLPEGARREPAVNKPRPNLSRVTAQVDVAAVDPLKTDSPAKVVELMAQLSKLDGCYTSECEYPRTDSRSYTFAVGQDLHATLMQMAEWCRTHGIDRRDVSETAVHFMESEDGHVQAAALDLMSTQPTSLENLRAILQNIFAGNDSELIDFALVELERYTAPSERALIAEALAGALITGSPYVAREVAKHMAPFIDERNYPYFVEVVNRLPENSSSRADLEASLSDFRRRRPG